MLGVYTILEVAEDGWGATQTLGLGAVSLALLARFVARQARIANPLMPLRLFRSRNVSGANVVRRCWSPGCSAMFFLGALYLQRILGYDPLEVGLAFLPATLVMGTLSLRLLGTPDHALRAAADADPGPRLDRRSGCCSSPGRRSTATTSTDLLPAMLLHRHRRRPRFPALMTLAMSGATPQDAGLASGLVNTTVQVGGAIGLAVLATLATERTRRAARRRRLRLAPRSTRGYHLAYLVGAGAGRRRPRGRRSL